MTINVSDTSRIQPFVKWAGGKRQLLRDIRERMPESYQDYYEPFVGGGAVFLELRPQRALINDINASLINAYCQIRDNPNGVISALDELDGGQLECADAKAYYYEARSRYNERISSALYDIATASLFIFINKHCFNGLYRVNAKGLFNVPYNGSTQASYSTANILALSEALSGVEITNSDFEVACAGVKSDDFVFFDSPYAPLNATSFESYTKEGFSKEEHIRLARLFESLSGKGCKCMLTNHDTPFIRDLYKDYNVDVVAVRRAINSNAKKRTGTEVIITNY